MEGEAGPKGRVAFEDHLNEHVVSLHFTCLQCDRMTQSRVKHLKEHHNFTVISHPLIPSASPSLSFVARPSPHSSWKCSESNPEGVLGSGCALPQF